MSERFDNAALTNLFLSARSRNAWRKEQLPESIWYDIYDPLKMGPTSANVSPGRFLFCTSEETKARVARHMSATNAAKSVDAAAIVIIAQDLDFARKIPQLFPHNPGAQHWFGDPQVRHDTAFRNATLQAPIYARRPRRGPGLRPDVGLRPAGTRRGLFRGQQPSFEFPVRAGARDR
ncbi:hypothetical protein [Sphingobium aromaticivastans]|uniref:hypothetical protein n=1 Tax=Sphingobium aromaticivastans TaxID=1778665 RepID=UPI00301754D6